MNVLASIFMLTLPGAGIVAAGVLVALIGSVLAVQAPPDRRYVLLMAARGPRSLLSSSGPSRWCPQCGARCRSATTG